MRVYKFLNESYGRENLRKKRLKLSRLHELNDPFELTPYRLTNPNVRLAFIETRNDLGNHTGLGCFSSAWCNPVIWGHYSNCHRGLCLGFEVPDIGGDGPHVFAKVDYIVDPLPFPTDLLALQPADQVAVARRILFTKYVHWQYESEIRVWAGLEDEENGHYFISFGDELKLVQVILGARCGISRQDINDDLGPDTSEVEVIKARTAYDRFEMLVDEDWQ